MKKIKIKINSIQQHLFDNWNHDSRYSYNKAINLLQDEYYSKLELRNLITPEVTCCRIPWILKTPKAIREAAVFEAHKNFKSAFTNLKNKHIKHFNITYKTKKKISWTITVPQTALKVCNKRQIGLYEERTTNTRLVLTEDIENINNDCNIHYDGLNYYLCVPEERKVKTNGSKNWTCAIDPGLRKFQTIYNVDNDDYLMIGDRASSKMYKYLMLLDKLISNGRNKNKKQILKLRLKIKNKQKELHDKTIHFLCENYNQIYIPKLTKDNDIVRKENRKIKSETVRKMVVLGHSTFVEKLKTKADLYKNVWINQITEEYTSQECLKCRKKTKVTSEIYKCKECGYTIDRDILGSTNIWIKNGLEISSETIKKRDTANVDMRCSLDILEWRKLVANSEYLCQKNYDLGNDW